MSEEQSTKPGLDLDTAFLKSKRGALKLAQTGSVLVGLVCFAASSSSPQHSTAWGLELLLLSLLLVLYMLRLNKRLSFFFWPLVDVFNSVFAAVYLTVLSLLAVSTYTATGTLVGGVVGLVTVGLLCADGYLLFRNITFNKPRTGAHSPQQN